MLIAGVGDYLTGVDLTFTLLYIFPICLGTWFRGKGLGISLALLAALCGTLASLYGSDAPPRALSIAWNQAGSLGIFVLIVLLLARLRTYVEKEQQARRLAVEQLRHGERLHLIGRLAAGVAHELGTPLNVVSGHAELLGGGRMTPAQIEEASRGILTQTARISAIVRHLLDFGRRGGAARSPVDVNHVAVEAVRLLASTAAKRRVAFHVQPSARPLTVLVNASEIEQVLVNIMWNGVQAMPKGGEVRVGIDAELRRTDEGELHRFAVITIEDDGVGIAAAHLPHIFDPFFTTKGVGEGTGLGLSVSYGIVEDHGGRIEVESDVGRGSRFRILLLLADESSQGGDEAPS
jgi:signal transduction histidine kinase